MRRLARFLFVIFTFQIAQVFAVDKTPLLLDSFDIMDLNNPAVYPDRISNSIKVFQRELESSGLFILKISPSFTNRVNSDKNTSRSRALQTGCSASLRLLSYFIDDTSVFRATVYPADTNLPVWDDETYTTFTDRPEALDLAASDLADRLAARYQDEILTVYREPFPAETNEEIIMDTNENSKNTLLRISLLTLGGIGYSYPLGGEVSVLKAWTVWLNPSGFPGIGIGSQLARLYLTYPGIVNVTGTILPLQVMFPLYIQPEAEKLGDLYLSAEWAWYAPFQGSGTNNDISSTNTNVSSLLNPALNYLEMKAEYYPLPFTTVTGGAQYYYRTGGFYFYLQASAYLGFYRKE